MKNHVKFEHTRYRVYLVSWILNFPMFVNVNSDLVRTLPLKLVKCRSWDMFGINSFPCRVLLLRLILGRLFSSFDCQPLLRLDPWYFSSKPWYFSIVQLFSHLHGTAYKRNFGSGFGPYQKCKGGLSPQCSCITWQHQYSSKKNWYLLFELFIFKTYNLRLSDKRTKKLKKKLKNGFDRDEFLSQKLLILFC